MLECHRYLSRHKICTCEVPNVAYTKNLKAWASMFLVKFKAVWTDDTFEYIEASRGIRRSNYFPQILTSSDILYMNSVPAQ